MILAETWLSERDSNTYDIQNFEQIRMDSTIVQSHQGLLAYLKKDEKCFVTMTQLPYLEICQCAMPYRDTMLSVLGIYRPPATNLQRFKEELFQYITACNVQSTKVIVGDFNINVKKDVSHSFLQEMQEKFHLRQFIQEPTTSEGTTIDLVFSNLSHLSVKVLTNTWSSHQTLSIYIPK